MACFYRIAQFPQRQVDNITRLFIIGIRNPASNNLCLHISSPWFGHKLATRIVNPPARRCFVVNLIAVAVEQRKWGNFNSSSRTAILPTKAQQSFGTRHSELLVADPQLPPISSVFSDEKSGLMFRNPSPSSVVRFLSNRPIVGVLSWTGR